METFAHLYLFFKNVSTFHLPSTQYFKKTFSVFVFFYLKKSILFQ